MKQTKHFKRTAFNLSAKSMVSLMLLLIAMLMPQGVWATDFISEVKYGVHSKQDNAKGYLSGYTIIDNDFNNGTSGDWVYIGYKTSTNAADAITGLLVVVNDPESTSTTYGDSGFKAGGAKTMMVDGKRYYLAEYGGNADMNNGNDTHRNRVYLYYTKDGNTTNGAQLITTLGAHRGELTANPAGLSVVPLFGGNGTATNGTYSLTKLSDFGDTNKGGGGSFNYITYTTHTHSYNNSATFNWASDSKTCTADIDCTCGDKHTGIACTVTWDVKTPATCTVMGWTTYTAKVTYNGKNFSAKKDIQDIAALDHSYTSQTATDTYLKSAATCTADAVYYYKCSRCDSKGSTTWTKTGTALDHNYTLQVAADAYRKSYSTCTSDEEYYYLCSVCRTKGNTSWAKAGTMRSHSMSKYEGEDATCTANGNETYYVCSWSCCNGKYYKDNAAHTTNTFANREETIIPAKGHGTGTKGYTPTYTWGGTYDDATCTFRLQCGSCGAEVFNDNITTTKVPANHVDATCARAGNERWTATGSYSKAGDATYNGEAQTEDYVIPATGLHTFDDVTDPHHTLCTVCDHSFFRYTSSTKNAVDPYNADALLDENDILLEFTNTYIDGKGVIEFNKPLVTIGYNTFYQKRSFTGDLILPITVKTIGKNAFNLCSGFTKLILPNSLTSIGESAFSGCAGLTGDLILPNTLTSIEESAFSECAGLKGNLILPNSVTSIGYAAFQNCSNLTGDLILPNTVESIAAWAFQNCSSFSGVIMKSVPAMRPNVFSNVTSNKTVVLSDNSYVYKGSNSYFPTVTSVTAPCNLDLTGSAVENHANLTINHGNIIVDAAVAATCTTGGLSEGSHCDICHTVLVAQEEIPAIGHHTFAASDLTHDVCTVCGHGFLRYEAYSQQDPNNAENLKDKVGNTLTIVSHTFDEDNWQGVMEFNAPLVTIGDGAFDGCRDFTKVTIPHTVSEIGQYAFGYMNPECSITLRSLPSLTSYYQTFFFTDIMDQEQKSEITPAIELDDNSYVSSGFFESRAGKISYTRKGIKNQWGTIVVPFVISNGDDYDFYTLSSVSSDELTLTKVDGTLNAGTPALIRINSELVGDGKTYDLELPAASHEVNTQGTLTGTPAGDLTLTGSYEVKDITDEDGYIISNNKFWSIQDVNGSNSVYCAPFRAYIASSAPALAKALNINISEEADAIEAITAITEGDAEYYDLNGRKLNSLQTGVNIVKYSNGKTKKVIVK